MDALPLFISFLNQARKPNQYSKKLPLKPLDGKTTYPTTFLAVVFSLRGFQT
ncbi:hypothetical protein V202x_47020 [Gimesia aquarii]|uniref:Uncharacterized protein n=1 Tax=Gimesia aquarii TaxID=2527964 RepID=A0A517X1A2_9PLAN|nr:hypothetical protein V202x_47020 [Gimesia aquarii]